MPPAAAAGEAHKAERSTHACVKKAGSAPDFLLTIAPPLKNMKVGTESICASLAASSLSSMSTLTKEIPTFARIAAAAKRSEDAVLAATRSSRAAGAETIVAGG